MILFRPSQYVIAFFAAVSILSSAAFENSTAFRPGSVHKRMTAEEVQQIFQTTHDSVPDYEVVQVDISRLVKRGSRSTRAFKFIAFNEKKINITLWLQPTEGTLAREDTPVKTVERDAKGKIVYEDYPNAMKKVGRLLEDPKTKASVVVRRDSRGRHSVNGYVLSEKLVIRSLPESISEDLLKDRLTENPDSLNHSKITRSAYHVVFKREIKDAEKRHKSFGITQTRIRQSRAPTSTIPDVVYPEIMVVVDSTYMAINGNNIDKILAYVVTFWNGVDLMYRSFEGPKFRFNIARVIIAKGQSALPYIWQNLVVPKPDAYRILDGMKSYYYSVLKDLPSKSYDAIVTMTRLDMTDYKKKEDVLGLSEFEGACRVRADKKLVDKVAIVTDHDSFDGVITAAHEFAHLLGADHVSEERGCSSNTENTPDFSSCTVRNIQEYLSKSRATCLYNVPNSSNPLPRVLPGKLRNRNHQCQSIGYGKSCYTDEKTHQCTGAIYCNDPKKPNICRTLNNYHPADGAFCSAGKVCLHGKCLVV